MDNSHYWRVQTEMKWLIWLAVVVFAVAVVAEITPTETKTEPVAEPMTAEAQPTLAENLDTQSQDVEVSAACL